MTNIRIEHNTKQTATAANSLNLNLKLTLSSLLLSSAGRRRKQPPPTSPLTDRASPMLPSATANLTSTTAGSNFELTGYETAQNPQAHENSVKVVLNQPEIGRSIIGKGKYGILFAKHINKSTSLSFVFAKRSANEAAHLLAKDVLLIADRKEWGSSLLPRPSSLMRKDGEETNKTQSTSVRCHSRSSFQSKSEPVQSLEYAIITSIRLNPHKRAEHAGCQRNWKKHRTKFHGNWIQMAMGDGISPAKLLTASCEAFFRRNLLPGILCIEMAPRYVMLVVFGVHPCVRRGGLWMLWYFVRWWLASSL
nr:hypothetical protein Iba_scaffold14370CG0520 [Ipomoea batatas]